MREEQAEWKRGLTRLDERAYIVFAMRSLALFVQCTFAHVSARFFSIHFSPQKLGN
jgi:hypothetical protein